MAIQTEAIKRLAQVYEVLARNPQTPILPDTRRILAGEVKAILAQMREADSGQYDDPQFRHPKQPR